MAKPTLTDRDKQEICKLYTSKTSVTYSQDAIAYFFGVSRRTIHRVLQSEGILPETAKITNEERRILSVVKNSGFSISQLQYAIQLAKMSNRQKGKPSTKATQGGICA